jgi:ribosomal protein S18 acetylase RimI-like enzyme
MKILVQNHSFEIRPVTELDKDAILEVYRQCENFLALGPVHKASIEMVLADLKLSKEAGGVYCGIIRDDGLMVGVVDYVPGPYHGDPQTAFLELLMIAEPYRLGGIGRAVFEAVEQEIKKDPQIKVLRSGVQVNNPQAIRFWQHRGFRIISGPDLIPDQTTVYGLKKEFDLF